MKFRLKRGRTAHTDARQSPDPAFVNVIIGPANSAGQGYGWATAINKHIHGFAATNYTVVTQSTYSFPSASSVTAETYRDSLIWAEEERAYLSESFSYGLWESGRHPLGLARKNSPWEQIAELERAGVRPAFVAHGSDVRLPSMHAAEYAWSPFRDRRHQLTEALEVKVAKTLASLQEFHGPRFVSTPDLLRQVPDAKWLPVVVGAHWLEAPTLPISERVLRVGHATSNSMIKRSDQIELVIEPLIKAGMIEYEQISGRSPDQMPAELAKFDVVLDQFGVGAYGVAACEAMALGCVVVGNVTTDVRQHIHDQTGHELPIVQAELGTIPAVLARLLDEPDERQRLREAGPKFVREVHDGRLSAGTLRPWLTNTLV